MFMEEDHNKQTSLVPQPAQENNEKGNLKGVKVVMSLTNPNTNKLEDVTDVYPSHKASTETNYGLARTSPNDNASPSYGFCKEVMVIDNPPSKIKAGENPLIILEGERDRYGKLKPLNISMEEGTPFGNYDFMQSDHKGQIYQTPSILSSSQSQKNRVVSAYISIDGKFYEGEYGYYLFHEQNETYTQMTDFFVEILEKQVLKAIDGTTEEIVKVKLYDNENWEKFIEIPYEEWTNLFAIIEKMVPERLIATDEIPNIKKFQRLASSIIRHSEVKVNEILQFWGWGPIRGDGSRKFYHGGLEDCKSAKSLSPPITDSILLGEIIRDVLDIIKVGPSDIVATLLVYSAASYMDALFTDSGHFLSHCLMLIGPSGMMKTSLARVIFSPFLPVKDRIETVRSTEASMHVLHEKAYDDTLVIDDFNREGSIYEVKAKMKNLQTLIRSYSDKSPRAKYGGKDDIKKYAIRGGCTFTGETGMTGELKSGMLRYIKLSLNQRLDGVILKKYQDSPEKITIFFSEFIRYLERKYVFLVNYFKEEFESWRKDFERLREPRLIDAFAHLSLSAETILKFTIDNNAMSEAEANKWYKEFLNGLFDILSKQSIESVTIEPYILYLKEIWNLIGTGAIEVAYDLGEYMDNMKKYIGYADGDLYMFKNEALYKAVSDSFKNKNDYLTMSLQEVTRALRDHELSECNKGSCLKKASSRLPGRPLMLALIKPKCEKLLEEMVINE